MCKCENHPDCEAKWLRDSWVLSSDPVPVCDTCKNHYEDLRLDKALNLRPILGGQQGREETVPRETLCQ